MKTTKQNKGLTQYELIFLCGFIQMKTDDTQTTIKEERKQLRIILNKLRELKK